MVSCVQVVPFNKSSLHVCFKQLQIHQHFYISSVNTTIKHIFAFEYSCMCTEDSKLPCINLVNGVVLSVSLTAEQTERRFFFIFSQVDLETNIMYCITGSIYTVTSISTQQCDHYDQHCLYICPNSSTALLCWHMSGWMQSVVTFRMKRLGIKQEQ